MTEIERELGRNMVYMFDIPKDQEVSFVTPPPEEKIFDINQILKTSSTKPPLPPTTSIPLNHMNPYNYFQMGYPVYPPGVVPPVAGVTS